MPPKYFNKISEGLARAAELRRCAAETADPIWKAHLRDLELQWLDIVESYKFASQAGLFLEDLHARRSASNGKLAQQV